MALQLVGDVRSGAKTRRVAAWLLPFLLTVIVAFLPLVVSGVLSDFLRGLRHSYSGVQERGLRPVALLIGLFRQFENFGYLVVLLALFLVPKSNSRQRMAAYVWLVAFLAVLFYEPISPRHHFYLKIPLVLVFTVSVAVLTQLLLEIKRVPMAYRLLSVMLLLGISCKTTPEFCTLRPSLRAATAVLRGERTDTPPPGYRHGRIRHIRLLQLDGLLCTLKVFR